MKRWLFLAALCLAMLPTLVAHADEVVRTTDGRAILLRSDGTYSEVGGVGPVALLVTIAAVTTYTTNKANILTCLADEPDGPDKMQSYFAEDEEKARLSWLAVGGSPEEWSQIDAILKKKPVVANLDCKAVLDGWARFEPESLPLSMRSPFKELAK